MPFQIFSQTIFILRLLVYSAIASAVIKYAAPNWVLLNNLTVDMINAIALSAITIPVGLFAFVLWVTTPDADA